MRELMAQSLVAWRLAGSVRVSHDATIVISCGTHEICIKPASPGSPFRWIVTIGNRTRGAISIVGVLRQVRAALDPGYATMRPLITTLALAPLP
jgi:hypothetical protein